MKITKCITFIFCLLIGLLLTSEMRVKYFISEMNSNRRSFCLEENTSDDILIIINNLAEKYNVTAYIKNESVKNHVETEYTFYQTSDFDKEFRYTYKSKIKSIFYGNIAIKRLPLTSFSNIRENTYFIIKGSHNELDRFMDELENHTELLDVNAYDSNYGDDMITTYLLIWTVIAVFLFLVSLYQVSVFKREKMIAICNGSSPFYIILQSISSELACILPITVAAAIILKNSTSLKIDCQLIIILSAIIITSIIPYFTYVRFNIRSISHENKMLANLVRLSRFFKVIITALLIGIIVSSAASIKKLIKSYESSVALEKYHGHDIVKIKATDLDDVPNEYFEIDQLIAQMYADEFVLKEIYSRFYEECNITIIDCHTVADNCGKTNIIYCNGNSAEYVNSKFSQYISDSEIADVYFLIPESELSNDKRIDSLKTNLKNYNCRSNLNVSVVYYDNNVKFNYFDSFENLLIGNTEDPCLIFDTTPPTTDSLSSHMIRLGTSNLTMVMNDDLKAYLNKVNAVYETFNLKESVEYQMEKSKSEMLYLIAVMIILMILEIIMTYNIFSFDYRRNTKEYCLKRAFGSDVIGKYKGQFLYIFLIYILSILAACVLFKIKNIPLVIILGIFLLLIDLISIVLFIIRTENKKVIAVLKGGML